MPGPKLWIRRSTRGPRQFGLAETQYCFFIGNWSNEKVVGTRLGLAHFPSEKLQRKITKTVII